MGFDLHYSGSNTKKLPQKKDSGNYTKMYNKYAYDDFFTLSKTTLGENSDPWTEGLELVKTAPVVVAANGTVDYCSTTGIYLYEELMNLNEGSENACLKYLKEAVKKQCVTKYVYIQVY